MNQRHDQVTLKIVTLKIHSQIKECLLTNY